MVIVTDDFWSRLDLCLICKREMYFLFAKNISSHTNIIVTE